MNTQINFSYKLFRLIFKLILLYCLTASAESDQTDSQQQTLELKILSFNILSGGSPVAEIGNTSPLFRKPRYEHIAAVILQTGADIVGVTEPNEAKDDPILKTLIAADPKWQKRGNLYAKFPIEPDPNLPGDLTVHLVRVRSKNAVICHVAHWKPVNGYGPDVLQKRILEQNVPDNPVKLDQEVATSVNAPKIYQATLDKVKIHLSKETPVFVMGDFNEPSHLDWTEEFAIKGKDTWVKNPSNTPLRFKITWPGSLAMFNAGLIDSYRSVYPDPVTHPGPTWTPAYGNDTPGRRPYDGNSTLSGIPNQVLVRIDCIFHAGKGVTAKDAAVVGENPANAEHNNRSDFQPDIQYNGPWPSDHRAVMIHYRLSTK